jgi:hypothetical protein
MLNMLGTGGQGAIMMWRRLCHAAIERGVQELTCRTRTHRRRFLKENKAATRTSQ